MKIQVNISQFTVVKMIRELWPARFTNGLPIAKGTPYVRLSYRMQSFRLTEEEYFTACLVGYYEIKVIVGRTGSSGPR